MKKILIEVAKTIVFIPAGIVVFVLIMAIAGGIDLVIFKIVGSMNPNSGSLLDGARKMGIFILYIIAFGVSCGGLSMDAIMLTVVPQNLSPSYLPKTVTRLLLAIILLFLTFVLFRYFYLEMPSSTSILQWIALIIGILSMLTGGVFGIFSAKD